MKLIKVNLKPLSSFRTYPKGDTLFGQFIFTYALLNGKTKVDDLSILNEYDEKPPFIISDFIPSGFFYRPTLKSSLSIELLGDESVEKDGRKIEWIEYEPLLQNRQLKLVDKSIYKEIVKLDVKVQNSINREIFSTTNAEDGFTPYANMEYCFKRYLYTFILFDENFISQEEIINVLEIMGINGFGADNSIGKGRFEVKKIENVEIKFNSNHFITTSPSSLDSIKNNIDSVKDKYYKPFTRFGKHSNENRNPFKKPIFLADSGAYVIKDGVKSYADLFVGTGLKNISDDKNSKAVHQAYSIIIPFKGSK